MKIRITKLEGKPDSHTPIGYWVEGTETVVPTVDRQYVLDDLEGRISTSKDERFDWFITTKITGLTPDGFTTKNSKWKREELAELIDQRGN